MTTTQPTEQTPGQTTEQTAEQASPETARQARRRALLEDAEWLAETGETMPGAAARLRLHPDKLRDRLKSAGRGDLWARLIANADPGYPVTASIRRAA